MGSGGVAIAALPTVICLKVPFSDSLGGGGGVASSFVYGRFTERLFFGGEVEFMRLLVRF